MKFVLASGNQHKADEIGALLPAHFELVLQKDLGVESPIETGTTFIENAIIKAKPSATKGRYIENCVLSSTMSPGISLDIRELLKAA